jgi:uncharacterized protein (DUF1330 family)
MPKAYWISFYREILDPNKLAAYAKLAGPAIEKGGGRFLARGTPAQVYEEGQLQRTVIIEFESVAKAIEVHRTLAGRSGKCPALPRCRPGQLEFGIYELLGPCA